MVKLARGGMNNSNRGRSKPRPLFPPGELPLFGPPPAYMRRPGPPVPPAVRGHMGYDYVPPPPPMRLPPHLGPPMPPPPHMPMRGRPGRPAPPMPLLQAPVMPPRPMPFMRGRGMGPRMGPGKKLGKGIKKAKNRRNKKGAPSTSSKPDGEYYCEVCDRSWMTAEELELHISEHVTCSVNGCSFTAAPKIIALHIKLQHDSGMFDKIVKTRNKEDIEKWKEERRRNYPTAANVEKKMAREKEMKERGESIETMNESFQKNKFHYNCSKTRLEGKSFRKKRRNHSKNNLLTKEMKSRQQFLSTASLPNDLEDTKNEQEFNISDEEWISDNQGVIKETQISNVLMNLSVNYASDNEYECQEKVSGQRIFEKVEPLPRSRESDDEPPCEEKISRQTDFGVTIEEEAENKCRERFSKRKRMHNKHKPKHKPKVMNWQPSLCKRPLTLLEKLLAKEIKQERNYILQCIRYIINENYFDV